MAEQTNLPRIDACPVEYEDFHNVMARWLTDLVDQLNASLQQLDDVIHVGQSDNVSATPAAAVTVPLVGVTPTSLITALISSSTNPVTITSIVPGTDQFVVNLSGDPGISIIINYTAIVATI